MIIIQGYILFNSIKSVINGFSKKTTQKGSFYKKKRKFVLFYKKLKKKYIHKDDLSNINKFIYNWNLPERVVNTYGRLVVLLIEQQWFLRIYYKINCFLIPKIKQYPHTIYGLIFLLPKILVYGIYFVDVIFFFKIDYFYKFLWLLLIPIFFKIFLYTIKIASVFRLKALSQIIRYEVIEKKDIDKYPLDQLCNSEDENQIFFINWVNDTFAEIAPKHEMLFIMTEVLNNRQITFFAEDLYDIEKSFSITIIHLFVTLITFIIWVSIFKQMAGLVS